MKKADRHLLIKQIITAKKVRTQDELLRLLEDEEVIATQATISRDIRDLQIVKTPDKDGQSYFKIFQNNNREKESEPEELKRIGKTIEEIVVKIQRVQFLTVVETIPDNAHLLAAMIDDLKHEKIVSTIAGFDTIVIISKSEEIAIEVEQFLRSHLMV